MNSKEYDEQNPYAPPGMPEAIPEAIPADEIKTYSWRQLIKASSIGGMYIAPTYAEKRGRWVSGKALGGAIGLLNICGSPSAFTYNNQYSGRVIENFSNRPFLEDEKNGSYCAHSTMRETNVCWGSLNLDHKAFKPPRMSRDEKAKAKEVLLKIRVMINEIREVAPSVDSYLGQHSDVPYVRRAFHPLYANLTSLEDLVMNMQGCAIGKQRPVTDNSPYFESTLFTLINELIPANLKEIIGQLPDDEKNKIMRPYEKLKGQLAIAEAALNKEMHGFFYKQAEQAYKQQQAQARGRRS